MLLIASAVCLAAPATSRAADSLVAGVPRQTPIDAYAGRVVWSAFDPAVNAYRLTEHVGGQTRLLPIPPRAAPFDVDLGPDRRDRTVAVYSRCEREVASHWRVDGRCGCDVFSYDFSSGEEARVTAVSSDVDEILPTLWRGAMAFTRVHPYGREARRLLYWRPLTPRARSHRLRSDHSGWAFAPSDLDMRGTRVGVVWEGEWGSAEVRVSRLGGRPRLAGVVPGSGAAALEYSTPGVSLAGPRVYWMVAQSGEPPYLAEIRRRRTAGGREERVTLTGAEASNAFSQDGAAAYYARPASGIACRQPSCLHLPHEVRRLDGLVFEQAPRLQLR